MEYRVLGRSETQVSAISLGAGPISQLMVGEDRQAQRDTVAEALRAGMNWFDTAATYGNGESESSLGTALASSSGRASYHIATKVRLAPEQLDDIPTAVRESFAGSLQRLRSTRVTLLQLHNSVTAKRGDLPTSVTVDDVLGKHGVITAFDELRAEGLVDHFGFTGLGDKQSVAELVQSHRLTSAQVPFNLLTSFHGQDRSSGSVDVDYAELVEQCASNGVGVIAIRIFAGGALVGQEPAPHTYKTKFFPLELYHRDQQRAASLQKVLPPEITLAEAAVRFVLSKPGVSTALIGFASPAQIKEAIAFAANGPLEQELISRIEEVARS